MTRTYIESDEELRRRIAQKYGMWGAFLSVVLESRGTALDDCAESIGLKRIITEVPYPPDSTNTPAITDSVGDKSPDEGH